MHRRRGLKCCQEVLEAAPGLVASAKKCRGEAVSSESGAEAMSVYPETVQWSGRPAGLIGWPSLGETTQIRFDDFAGAEVKSVVKKLRSEKSSWCRFNSAKFWRAVVEDDCMLMEVTSFVNQCWRQKEEVPSE